MKKLTKRKLIIFSLLILTPMVWVVGKRVAVYSIGGYEEWHRMERFSYWKGLAKCKGY